MTWFQIRTFIEPLSNLGPGRVSDKRDPTVKSLGARIARGREKFARWLKEFVGWRSS